MSELDVKVRPYNITVQQVNQRQLVPIAALCNGITIINHGSTVAFVNNVPIYPGIPGTSSGESIAFGGNAGEVYKGMLDIRFSPTNTGNVTVLQKIYMQ